MDQNFKFSEKKSSLKNKKVIENWKKIYYLSEDI